MLYNGLSQQRAMMYQIREERERQMRHLGQAALGGLGGLYGQAVGYPDNSPTFLEQAIEKFKKPTKSTPRTELQAETDEWLKDVL